MSEISTRAAVVARRTYSRPLNKEGTLFETWIETVQRVIKHQRWLWSRAVKARLTDEQEAELSAFEKLLLEYKGTTSGRTLWLGGTNIAKTREASQFNCSFSRTSTIHDAVDHFWLLLQGCGVGSQATIGTLNGFSRPVKDILVTRSTRTLDDWENGVRGADANKELFEVCPTSGEVTWRLVVGDSAASWAKAYGKLLAMKKPVDYVHLDFSEIRAAGVRLSGYGWISSGDGPISVAFTAICNLLSERADKLLTRIDILDLENHIGTTLSSRRSAEIVLCPYNDPEWEAFALAKTNYWASGNIQRAQSNNSLVFESRPSKAELFGIFHLMQMAGGSEPGFINGEVAKQRAPWFSGVNPCAEILLGDKSFCNLVELDLGKFNGDFEGLLHAIRIQARANYRQTCVNLKDGVLQESWHELNEFLRLCGVGVTGIVKWEHHMNAEKWRELATAAREGAHSMADELGLPRSKAITTVKPSGTLSKVMDTTEGVHKPLGKYIFNNIGFGLLDPLVSKLRQANYTVFPNPLDPTSTLVTFPVAYEDVEFEEVTLDDGRVVHVNRDSAVTQLNRYKMLMDNYVDHNCSVTISYSPEEVPAIVDWVFENWSSYVGVSFLYRADPTKTAADLGYAYLPQEVVTKEAHDTYVSTLLPVDLGDTNSFEELRMEECSTGACPIK